jgi:hypothetical protein
MVSKIILLASILLSHLPISKSTTLTGVEIPSWLLLPNIPIHVRFLNFLFSSLYKTEQYII